MDGKVLDEKGLVRPGEFLILSIPATQRYIPFLVRARQNSGYEEINYGPLPFTANETLDSFDGGSVTVPAAGVLPARAYTKTGKTFPGADVLVEKSDMWYVTEDYRDRLFHVKQFIAPDFVRVGLEIPPGTTQAFFQKSKQALLIKDDWGFKRGSYETVHLPKLHYGYLYANDLNIQVWTSVKFVYGEYIVKIPSNAELIFNILTRKVPAHEVTLPVTSYTSEILNALKTDYGFEGFDQPLSWKRDEMIKSYNEAIELIKKSNREDMLI